MWGQVAAGAASGGTQKSMAVGGTVAQSGFENNYLDHTQSASYERELRECGNDLNCLQNVNDKYIDLSVENRAALLRCGSDKACLQSHIDEMSKVSKDNDLGQKLLSLMEQGKVDQTIIDLEKADRTDAKYAWNVDELPYPDFSNFEETHCAGAFTADCIQDYNATLHSNAISTGVVDAEEALIGSTGIGGTALGIYGCAAGMSVASCSLAALDALGGAGDVLEAGSKLVLKFGDETVEVVSDGAGNLKPSQTSGGTGNVGEMLQIEHLVTLHCLAPNFSTTNFRFL